MTEEQENYHKNVVKKDPVFKAVRDKALNSSIFSQRFKDAITGKMFEDNPRLKDYIECEMSNEDMLHLWFGLSYAQYLTIPRSVLQSMPLGWKNRLAALLKELDDAIDWYPKEGTYRVTLDKIEERYDPVDGYTKEWANVDLQDPLMDYRHRPKIAYREDYIPRFRDE